MRERPSSGAFRSRLYTRTFEEFELGTGGEIVAGFQQHRASIER